LLDVNNKAIITSSIGTVMVTALKQPLLQTSFAPASTQLQSSEAEAVSAETLNAAVFVISLFTPNAQGASNQSST
jgi:hypothetical protein